jgi:hypothetical protein
MLPSVRGDFNTGRSDKCGRIAKQAAYERPIMPTFRSFLRYLLCAPWDLVVLLLVPLFCCLGARPSLRHGVVWLDVREGSLIHRRWRFSTTFGHVVLLQAGLCGSQVEEHELVHVQQYEGAVCSIWLMASVFATGTLLAFPWGGVALVALLAPWWGYAGASLAAYLRAKRPYLDNSFERHARAEVLTCGRA